MNILVFGGTGKLGHALQKEWPKGIYLGSKDLFFSQTTMSSFVNFFFQSHPDVVVNAAAVTDVGICEAEPFRAFQVNTMAAYNIARACAFLGIHMVFISSDYVFSGGRFAPPLKESDFTDPPDFYGHSKDMAEKLIASVMQGAKSRWWILRTAHLFGNQAGRPDIFQVMADKHRRRETFFANDEAGAFSLTPVIRMAHTILNVIEKMPPSGIYHAAGERADMRDVAGWFRDTFEGVPTGVAVPSSNSIRKPLNVVLNCEKLENAGIMRQCDWGWKTYAAEYVSELTEQP